MTLDSSTQVVQTKVIRRKILPIALIERLSVLLGSRF